MSEYDGLSKANLNETLLKRDKQLMEVHRLLLEIKMKISNPMHMVDGINSYFAKWEEKK